MLIQPVFSQHSPWLKIILFILLVLVSLLFVTLLGMLVAIPFFGAGFLESSGTFGDLSDPNVIARLKYLQIISQIGLFIVPVIVFSFMVTKEKAEYLSMKVRIPWPSMFAGAAVMLLALPFINWLGELNLQMKLPESMSGIEQWMMQSEKDAATMTKAFLVTSSPWSFIVNIFMIAILPAIGEELVFRGVLLRHFREWTKNIHVAIFITAFLFSAVHMQFYGFLPRFLMGMLFGYMVYWSGSIWVPVLAHFVNNGAAAVVAFLSTSYFPDADFNTFGSSDSPWIIAASVLFTTLIVVFLWMRRRKDEGNQMRFV